MNFPRYLAVDPRLSRVGRARHLAVRAKPDKLSRFQMSENANYGAAAGLFSPHLALIQDWPAELSRTGLLNYPGLAY